MLEIRFLKFFVILILISSCAYFEDEEETILPGKRESVFSSEEEVLLKANKRISIDTPSQVSHGLNNTKTLEITYSILKVIQN